MDLGNNPLIGFHYLGLLAETGLPEIGNEKAQGKG